MGDNESTGWGYDGEGEVILVVGRELVLVAFSIQDYKFLSMKTHNDEEEQVFFHLWPIGKSLMLRILRLSDRLDLLASAYEWCAS